MTKIIWVGTPSHYKIKRIGTPSHYKIKWVGNPNHCKTQNGSKPGHNSNWLEFQATTKLNGMGMEWNFKSL
jgi:hypothetical protein